MAAINYTKKTAQDLQRFYNVLKTRPGDDREGSVPCPAPGEGEKGLQVVKKEEDGPFSGKEGDGEPMETAMKIEPTGDTVTPGEDEAEKVEKGDHEKNDPMEQ